jgi:hypothetical protein
MRFGPLIVAITGAVLILLELRRFAEGGPSVFWMIVGALAIVLGVVGHVQRGRKPPEPPLPRL